MKLRVPSRIPTLSLIVAVALLSPGLCVPANADRTPKVRVEQAYAQLPLSFEANRGQMDSRVSFFARSRGLNICLTANEIILAPEDLRPPGNTTTKSGQGAARSSLRMFFVGASPTPRMAGLEELPGKVNYLIGNDQKHWRTNLPTYRKVQSEGPLPWYRRPVLRQREAV